MSPTLLDVLLCPRCGAAFSTPTGELLQCERQHTFRVVDGIPRFVDTPATDEARRTQASFGYEWSHFNDWEPSGEINFNDYFAGVNFAGLADALVLDAGCGMGRHARQVAAHVRHVIAVDFSAAIDQAARNTADRGNVDCMQADLTALPLRDAAFDFVYSLGVLHHIADTEATLALLSSKVKPGGRLRVYLYWRRTGLVGFLLACVGIGRVITTRLPFPILRAFCWLLSAWLWVAVILPYRVGTAIGIHAIANWPLFVYTKYPFTVLYNDQFDRFSAPIEKRYSHEEVRELLSSVGLTHVTVRRCYGWVADGMRPA